MLPVFPYSQTDKSDESSRSALWAFCDLVTFSDAKKADMCRNNDCWSTLHCLNIFMGSPWTHITGLRIGLMMGTPRLKYMVAIVCDDWASMPNTIIAQYSRTTFLMAISCWSRWSANVQRHCLGRETLVASRDVGANLVRRPKVGCIGQGGRCVKIVWDKLEMHCAKTRYCKTAVSGSASLVIGLFGRQMKNKLSCCVSSSTYQLFGDRVIGVSISSLLHFIFV